MEKDITEYETGARKLERRPELSAPDVIETGDRADRPKIPYGLTESVKDNGSATGHRDGEDAPAPREKAEQHRAIEREHKEDGPPENNRA